MAMRHGVDQPAAVERAAMRSRHIRFYAAFVQKHQPMKVQPRDLLPPCVALSDYIGPVLLGGSEGFFLRRLFSRSRPRNTAMMLPCRP
jgi:hypothetical protein